jgi:pyrroloquinoline quinone (PQQ) biosynthesis protein C
MRVQSYSVESFYRGSATQKLSELLMSDIESFVDEFRGTNELLQSTKAGRVTPHILGTYLRSLYFLIQQTAIHLSRAADRARSLGLIDLANHFAAKSRDEAGHEHWAEADMKRLSEAFGIVVPVEPTPEMRSIVDANEQIVMNDPEAYLAYILFAEYVTVVLGPEWLDALAKNCGISPSFVTVIEEHVELDKHHVLEGCHEIDTLVDPGRADAMRQALRGMTNRFASFCDALCHASIQM